LTVILVALVVRGIYLIETARVPFLKAPVGDALGYLEWASRIAMGDWIGREPFYQAPLYPYVLAVLFRTFGDGVWTIRIAQSIAGAIGCGLLAIAATRWFGSRVGVLAGLMLALYPPAFFFDGIVQKASLDAFLVCVLIWILARITGSATGTQTSACADPSVGVPAANHSGGASLTGSRLNLAALGVVSALLCLTRENALVWLPILAIFAAALSRAAALQLRIQQVLIYALGTAVVLFPVGFRNRVVGGEWSFSTFQAGPNFYIGNHRGADGRYLPLVAGHETPAFERADATRLAEAAMNRTLTAKEVSRYWMNLAVAEIRADPRSWLNLLGRKFAMVWNDYEVSDVESLAVYREFSRLTNVLGRCWSFGVLCPLTAVGLCFAWRGFRGWWVLPTLAFALSVSVAAFFVLARYRHAVVPLLVPFASVGVIEFTGLVRSGRWKRAGFLTGVAGAAFLFVHWPVHDERRLDTMAIANLGTTYGAMGDLERAQRFLRLALVHRPDSAEIHFNLGYALSLGGDDVGAVEHLHRALAIKPELADVDLLLGQSMEKLGRTSEARACFKRALAKNPDDDQAKEGLLRTVPLQP